MAGQADGSIVIDTELSSDGFKAGSDELLAAIKSLSQEVKALGTTLKEIFSQPLTPEVNTVEAEAKISELESKIKDLEAASDGQASTGDSGTGNVNFNGATQSASALQRQIDSVVASVDRLGNDAQLAASRGGDSLASWNAKAGNLQSRIDQLKGKLDQIGQAKTPTEEYNYLTKAVAQAEKELARYQDKELQLTALGVDEGSMRWKTLQYNIQLASQKVAEYSAELMSLESSGGAHISGVDTSQYQTMSTALSQAQAKLGSLQQGTAQASGSAGGLASKFQSIAAAIGKAGRSAMSTLASGIRSAASSMGQMLLGSRKMNSQFSGLISGARRFATSLLGARGIYTLLTKAASAYMNANTQLSNTLSSCWSGIGNLLGPIITRLVNLVAQAVAYVTAFLNLFGIYASTATSAIESAGGAASGAAEDLEKQLASFDDLNVLNQNDSGGGGGGGGGGSSASASLPEVELPDWAKLMAEQLERGDWAGAATTLANQLNKMVASVDWTGLGRKIGYYLNGALTFMATFIQKFDWTALGADLGSMLTAIVDGVDWGNLGVLLTAGWAIALKMLDGFFSTMDGSSVSKALTDFMNGTVNAADWVGLSSSLSKHVSDFIGDIDFTGIAQALSLQMTTALQSLSTAIGSFDWNMLGSKIANFLSGINWSGIASNLAALVSNALKGAMNLLIGFAETMDWAQLGKDLVSSLTNVVQNIDWGGIISLAFEMAGASLGGAAALWEGIRQAIGEGIANAFTGVTEYFQTEIEECGGNIVAGILKGIGDALVNIATWIVDNIFTPFINGFKNAFGIASPSTVMAEQGGFIVSGLLQGITGAWSTVTEFFTTALETIGTTISNAWDNIKSNTTSTWDTIKSKLSTTWSNIKANASTTWSNLKSTISDKWSNIKSNTTSTWDTIKSKLSTTWSNMTSNTTSSGNAMKSTMTSNWSGISSSLTNQWNTIKSNLSSTFTNMNSVASSMGNTIKATISTSWKNISSALSTTWSNIKSNLSSMFTNMNSAASSSGSTIKSTLSSAWSGISSTLSSAWSKIKSNATSAFSSMASSIKNQGWSSVGSNICSGISNGLDSGWNWLKTKVKNLANNLLNTAKKALDIRSPSRVFRDEVGYYIGLGVGAGIEDSEGSVLDSVAGVADAISQEFGAGGYNLGGATFDSSVDTALSSFTDKVTNSFTSMLDRLQAIAESVTFTVPAVANGAIPYALSGATGTSSSAQDAVKASNDELQSTMISLVNNCTASLVNAIRQYSTTEVNIDKSSLTTMVIEEINRRAASIGTSPLKI